MKKLLIASTALVATSGFAFANDAVTLGGSAQFGVIYIEDRQVGGEDDELFLDYELQFDFSAAGETDGGLGFGMSAELESDSNATADSNAQGFDPEIFITGAFGTLSVGDVDIATDGFGNTRDPGYDGIGTDNVIDIAITLGLDDFDPFLDPDGLTDDGADTNVRYDGTFGGLTLIATADSFDEDYSAVLSYDFGSFSAGVGYASVDEAPSFGGSAESAMVTVGAALAGFDLDFVYVDHSNDADVDVTGYGLSGEYDLGMYAITFAVNQVEIDDGGALDISGTSYGVGVSYDLGGGASLSAGVGSNWDPFADDDFVAASFGINMSF